MVASVKRTVAGAVVALATGALVACAQSSVPQLETMPMFDIPADEPSEETGSLVTLCKPSETSVFSGDVQDDLGLTISICLGSKAIDGGQTISIRSEGEGGGTVVSCEVRQCGGMIEFQHYRRYRFTLLTLTWNHDGSQQVLTESFDADDPSAPPVHSVSHSWTTRQARALGLEPNAYPVLPATEPLSLLKLESVMGDGNP